MHQLQTLIPRHSFETAQNHYCGNRYVKYFNCWNQFTVMLYALASGKESLRDIQNSLMVQMPKLYHLGLTSIKRSTLSDTNKRMDYRIYEELFYLMLNRCKNFSNKHKFKFKNPLMLLDATVIDLSITSFPWAKYMRKKGALRLHYQYDYSDQIPTFLVVTDAKQHEITVTRSFFTIVPDSIYCFDRGYIDFGWLYSINTKKAFFITRNKPNHVYRVTGQHTENKKNNIISDEYIEFSGNLRKDRYPEKLRLIRFKDPETNEILEFLTNNFTLSASTISNVYKCRWQIEVFFKWIKQNLKIKTFFGTSKNAVLTQIWVAMCYFLLLAYIKFQSKYKYSLFYLHKIIKETIMERLNLIDLLNITDSLLPKIKCTDQQLALTF